MKDLLTAIQLMKEVFGNDGDILLCSSDHGPRVRLTAYHRQYYAVDIEFSQLEIEKTAGDIFINRFAEALRKLAFMTGVSSKLDSNEIYRSLLR